MKNISVSSVNSVYTMWKPVNPVRMPACYGAPSAVWRKQIIRDAAMNAVPTAGSGMSITVIYAENAMEM